MDTHHASSQFMVSMGRAIRLAIEAGGHMRFPPYRRGATLLLDQTSSSTSLITRKEIAYAPSTAGKDATATLGDG